jgi:predicted membrane-bound spermidine synthase
MLMRNSGHALKCILFVSGFCSLLYQVVWQRLFGLVCSSDNVTASLVVAAFLFGLGAGNVAAAKLTRAISPRVAFRLLAVCEALITIFAFSSPMVYYDILFAYFLKNPVSLFQTFIILFISLLPPTFLMGMSMPLLGRAIVEKAENTASTLGDLYAANIVGAGTGALVTAFWLLGSLGMEFALYFGGFLNLCVAFGLWIMPHRFGDRLDSRPSVDWKSWLIVIALGFFSLPGRSIIFGGFHNGAFLPGLFIVACAYCAFERRASAEYRLKGAILILAAITFGAFIGMDDTLFLPATAALAFAIRCGSTRDQAEVRLGKGCLLIAATAFLAARCNSHEWAVFHYLTGAHWLFHSPDDDSERRRRGKLALGMGAAILLCLPKLLAGEVEPAMSSFFGVVAFATCMLLPFSADAAFARRDDFKQTHLVPLLIAALFVWMTTGEWLLAIAVSLTGGICVALWRHSQRDATDDTIRFSMAAWMVLAFASGFVAVSMELIWFRTLYTYFSGNAYVFGPMLATFLLCDGLGMWVAAILVKKTRNYGLAFLCTQILAVVSALLMYHVFMHSLYWNQSMFGMIGASLFLIGIPGFFLGFTFPFIQEAIQDDDTKIGSRIGLILFFNTLGNTAGGIVTAFVLLGYLGTIDSLFAIAAFPLAIALFCFFRKTARLSMGLVSGAILALCCMLPSNDSFWMRIHGMHERAHPPILTEDYSGVCMISVGDTATRFFLDERIKTRGTLFVSGYRQGDIPFGHSQTVMGLLGAGLHPNPKEVLCIGIGSASTPHLMGMRGSVTRIDMVELVEAEIPVLAAVSERDFGRYLGVIFSDPRYRLHIGDGRKFLFGAGQYDIIQADMRTAEAAGSGAIYSREFFEVAARRLKPGGYFIQQLFGKSTLATMQTVFPHVHRYKSFAIASNQPIEVSKERLFSFFDRELSSNLVAVGLNPQLIKSILFSYFESGDFVGVSDSDLATDGVHINTDLLPVDEFYLNRPLIPSNLSPKSWFWGRGN